MILPGSDLVVSDVVKRLFPRVAVHPGSDQPADGGYLRLRRGPHQAGLPLPRTGPPQMEALLSLAHAHPDLDVDIAWRAKVPHSDTADAGGRVRVSDGGHILEIMSAAQASSDSRPARQPTSYTSTVPLLENGASDRQMGGGGDNHDARVQAEHTAIQSQLTTIRGEHEGMFTKMKAMRAEIEGLQTEMRQLREALEAQEKRSQERARTVAKALRRVRK